MGNWFKRKSSAADQAVSRDTLLESLRYVVVDTELTSLDPRTNRLLSIGAIAMQGPSIALGEQFYRVVNTQVSIPAETVVIHKLRSEDVQAGEPFANVLEDFSRFVAGVVLVGHFVQVDLKILRKEMLQTGHKLDNPAIDTARVHHWLLRQGPYSEDLSIRLEKLDLAALASHYRVDSDNAHHALSDAFLTARIWQRMLPALHAKGSSSLRKVLRIAGV